MIVYIYIEFYCRNMQSFKRIFSKKMLEHEEEQKIPLLNCANDIDLNDLNILRKLIASLSRAELLSEYLTISSSMYEEVDQDELHKLKLLQNMKVAKDTLILFIHDDFDSNRDINGCKDDKCDYCDGILIGMVTEQRNALKNIDINIHLKMYESDGTIEYRDLCASYLNCENIEQISLYDEWRYWLLTTGKQQGFYKDFRQTHTYIIFPNHPLYKMFKKYYERPVQ